MNSREHAAVPLRLSAAPWSRPRVTSQAPVIADAPLVTILLDAGHAGLRFPSCDHGADTDRVDGRSYIAPQGASVDRRLIVDAHSDRRLSVDGRTAGPLVKLILKKHAAQWSRIERRSRRGLQLRKKPSLVNRTCQSAGANAERAHPLTASLRVDQPGTGDN